MEDHLYKAISPLTVPPQVTSRNPKLKHHYKVTSSKSHSLKSIPVQITNQAHAQKILEVSA